MLIISGVLGAWDELGQIKIDHDGLTIDQGLIAMIGKAAMSRLRWIRWVKDGKEARLLCGRLDVYVRDARHNTAPDFHLQTT